MTKDELDYERLLKQMDELQKKIANKKEILDRERDEAILAAIRKNNVTREQGFALAKILEVENSVDRILELLPPAEEKSVRKRKVMESLKEREEQNNEK